MKNRKKTLFIAKLLLGVVLLLVLLIGDQNAANIVQILSSINFEFLFLLFGIGVALNWISCLKWSLFLRERGTDLPLLRLLNLYFIGKFFSNFMPSMVGGDLTRSYLLGQQIHSQSKSFASVFLERFTGLLALLILSIVFSLMNPMLMLEPKIFIAIGFVLIMLVFILGVFLNRRLLGVLVEKSQVAPSIHKFLKKIASFQDDILFFRNRYALVAKAMAYSFTFHIFASVNVYVCCLSINLYPSFKDIAVITPIILLLNIVPVSPNNLGWWEWTFSFLLVEAGAGKAEGLTVALILRVMTLLFSLVGGAVFLFEKHRGE